MRAYDRVVEETVQMFTQRTQRWLRPLLWRGVPRRDFSGAQDQVGAGRDRTAKSEEGSKPKRPPATS